VSVMNRGISLPTKPSDVFARGYRSETARNKYPAGTGFGLYIAKRIVEIHEGAIFAETDENGWTVFTVHLSVSGLEGKARIREPKDSTSRRR
jgi:signal transduction histidine kinase